MITDDSGESVEVWYAGELQTLLGYARWENFVVAINRTVDSCITQGCSTPGTRFYAHSLCLLSDCTEW